MVKSNLRKDVRMVQIYGAEETKAFCCNCKKVTVHKYENFAKPEKAQETEKKGFFLDCLPQS